MRSLNELIDVADPAMPLLREWIASAIRPVEVLPPSPSREDVLFRTQVTTRSPMGAIAFETGGVLIDHGWLRILGSGHERLARTLPQWNKDRSEGFYLVADDAVGGFFAINGGALGEDAGKMYYLSPDSLRWDALGGGYSEFLAWAMGVGLDEFYSALRWTDWSTDVARLSGDRCFFFYPPLFTLEGKGGVGRRGDVPVHEAWGVQMDFRKQLGLGG